MVVKVLIIKYLKKVLDKLTEKFTGRSANPVVEHMLQVRGED